MTQLSPAQLQRTLSQAREAHQMGNLADAEPLYRKVLASEPRHFEALLDIDNQGHDPDGVDNRFGPDDNCLFGHPCCIPTVLVYRIPQRRYDYSNC